MDVPALIDHILATHHAPLHEAMPAIGLAMDEAPPSPACLAAWAAFRSLMETHLMKEEHVLFPTARALAEGRPPAITGFEGPLEQMSAEHEQVRETAGALAATLEGAGPHRAALEALLADLSEHTRIEDDELFPQIRTLAEAHAEAEAVREAEAMAAAAETIEAMTGERAPGGRRARLKRALRRLFER